MSKVKPGMFIAERYEIAALIGSGGTADVYKAMDRRLNRNVAIKILKSNFTSDKKIVEKFRQEAQSCAGLTHPNIVSVYDVGNDGDLYYIVMELIEGITLKKFIERKGKLEIKEAIGIAIQIAQGLDAAHANHVVHRDIKPQNIIISREGKVKVTDFGIARATLGTSTNTINQAPVGSVHYLSPEQARGGFSDERSDIYSLGVTIYEMLAGKVPFSGDNNVSVALLHIQGEATPLHEINPDVTPSVEKIVVKCMQKKPERRYFSAAELIKDLKASINNPTGDFVKLNKPVVKDSPTKEMSREEILAIKNQAHSRDVEGEEREIDDEDEDDRIDDADDEIDSVNTKTEKLIIIGSIILVVVLLGFVAYVFSKLDLFKNTNEPTPTVSIVKLSDNDIRMLLAYDYTLDQMQEALNSRNVSDFTSKGIYSDDVAENKVINMYYEGETLVVEYSRGKKPPETVIMVSVIGKTIEEARAELNGLSETFVIRVKASPEHTDDPINTIIEQSIAEGEAVTFTEEITLTYSIGPEGLVVPDFSTGAYTKDMVETQYGSKFKLKFEYDLENDYSIEKAGVVVGSDPVAGESIKSGDELTIYLSSEYVKLPQLTGKTEDEAKSLLYSIGLRANVSYVKDGDGTPGTVIKHSGAVNDTLDRGSIVNLTVIEIPPSDTPTPEVTDTPTPEPTKEAILMPNLVGSSLKEAQQKLYALSADFTFKTVEEHSPTDAGMVIGQSVAIGVELKGDETITLTISLGPAPALMPNVMGMTVEDAKNKIKSAADSVTIKVEEGGYSDYFTEGTVMEQSVPTDTQLTSETVVTLTISKGPEPTVTETPPENPENPENPDDQGGEGGEDPGTDEGTEG